MDKKIQQNQHRVSRAQWVILKIGNISGQFGKRLGQANTKKQFLNYAPPIPNLRSNIETLFSSQDKSLLIILNALFWTF